MTVLVDQFQLQIGTDHQLPLRFNVAPTQAIPIVRQTDDGRELASALPVILSPNDYAEWLDPQAKEPARLLTPFPASDMAAVAVNPIVNNARNEGPECVEPLAAE
jgi:putative SOS response-associated peptidase YedK